MNRRNFRIFPLFLMALLPPQLHGQDAPEPVPAAPYVSVSFEVNGLAESAALLNEAMRELSATLSGIAASPEDLTPEQLEVFAELTRETAALVETLDRTLQGLGPAIRSTEAPTRELLAGLIDTTRTLAIEPTIDSIDRRVRTWLMLTILGVVFVVALVGLGAYVATRQLRAVVGVLRSISDEYQIVPRQRATVAPPPASESSGNSSSSP